MKRPWLFGILTFLAGWLIQAAYLYVFRFAETGPNWLLLCTLALGAMGQTNLAQTLGFFWGLSLDVFGMSLFGSQGWLLALAGYASGQLSRQLNAEKLVTQEALAFFGTSYFWIGLYMFESIFRWGEVPRLPGAGIVLTEYMLNALVAPLVFMVMVKWLDVWISLEGEHAIFD